MEPTAAKGAAHSHSPQTGYDTEHVSHAIGSNGPIQSSTASKSVESVSIDSDFTTSIPAPVSHNASSRGQGTVQPRTLISQASFLSAQSSSGAQIPSSGSEPMSRSGSAVSASLSISELNTPMASATLDLSAGPATSIASTTGTSPTISARTQALPIVAKAPSSSKRAEPLLPSARVQVASPSAMYWSRTPAGGRVPKSLRAHSATMVGSDMWLFGGCDLRGTCFKDLYKYDTETYTWSKPKVLGTVPPVTRAHSVVAVDERIYVFGGGDGPTYYNDLYYFDTLCMAWTKPSVLGSPPSGRRAHAAVYYNSQLIIFGGGNGLKALNDVHALDLRNPRRRMRWSELKVQGRAPIPRGYHSMNLIGSKAVIFGGSDGTECFGDLFILDLEDLTWTEIRPELDPMNFELFPRLSHTCTTLGSYLVVLGGHDGIAFSNNVLFFNLVTLEWERREAAGQAPAPRGYHTTVLRDGRLLLYGGFNGQNVFDELYTLELASLAFLPQITRFEIGGTDQEAGG